MESTSILGTRDIYSLNGGLTNSLLDSATLSTGSENNSASTGLLQELKDPLLSFRASSSFRNADSNFLSSSWVSEGKFGDFEGRNDFQFTIKNDSGNLETFSLTGNGYGEVFKNSEFNFKYVSFTNTDASTSVSISAINNIKFSDYLGSTLNVQTQGSITAGNIILQNTNSSRPGLNLRSGLSDVQNSTSGARYKIADIGSLLAGDSYAYDINNSSQVVGFSNSSSDGSYHAFLYSDGQITDLNTLPGGSYSYAYGINDSGQIVGYAQSSDGWTYHAFLHSDDKMTDLGTLPGDNYSFANGINNFGQVVGYSNGGSNERHAFLYSDGTMTDLGTLPGGRSSIANAINNSGQVVGYSSGYDTSGDWWTHAFLYSSSQMTDLGTLIGGSYSVATNINNFGQVVGYADDSSRDGDRAFLYSGGKMTALGTLSGSSYSRAKDINTFGQVVGYSSGHAFLYSNGAMTDLNSLIPSESGWFLTEATAINDFGQIVGNGSIAGQRHAFSLDPILGLTPTPRDGITVGNISTLGSSIQLQGLKIKFTGSDVITKGGKITIDGPTVIGSSTGKLAFNSTKSTANSRGGDITFSNTVDGDTAGTQSLSLSAGTGNITFNSSVGSNATLKDLTVNRAKTVTATDITTDGDTTITATQDITTGKLTSNSGAIKLTSNKGAVTNQDITSSSDTAIAASQSISTGSILSYNGAVKLTSKLSSVTTKDITTNGSNVTVIAEEDVTTENIISNGGAIGLASNNGSITTGYLRSNGSGTGGNISLLAAALIKVQGTVPINGNDYSIYTGTNGGGSIRIQHGGGEIQIPFVVGDAAKNGTAGAISIGTSTISPTSSRHEFSGTYALGSGAASGIIHIVNSGSFQLNKSLKQQLIASEFNERPFGWLRALEWLGEKIFEGAEWTFEKLEEGFTQITHESGGRLVVEAGRKLSAGEAKVAAQLVREGRVVQAIEEVTPQGQKISDFLVDGVRTEVKNVSNLDVDLSAPAQKISDKLSNSLSRRIIEAHQQGAESVIVEVEQQPGMTRAIAERALSRASTRLEQLGSRVRQIRAIGKGFDVTTTVP